MQYIYYICGCNCGVLNFMEKNNPKYMSSDILVGFSVKLKNFAITYIYIIYTYIHMYFRTSTLGPSIGNALITWKKTTNTNQIEFTFFWWLS